MAISGCCPVISTTAAAPSLMPEALPAVTVPFLSKAGHSFAQRNFLLVENSEDRADASDQVCITAISRAKVVKFATLEKR